MQAVLVANGELSEATVPLLRTAVEQADMVVGVDGGTYHLLRLGILPHVVTGDFDSLAETDRISLSERGVQIIPTPDQDFTDLDKSVAVMTTQFEADSIRIFAATSGRLDHIYSVLSVVVKYGRQYDIRLVDQHGETWLVPGIVRLLAPSLAGRTLSLLALGRVEGVTTTGVRWPLLEDSLAPGVRDGTLNEVVSEEVEIHVRHGDLLVMLHHSRENGVP